MCAVALKNMSGYVHIWEKAKGEEREWYFKHTIGVLLGLHPPLCSHAVASAGQPSSECVSHSIRCWEAARFLTLVSDILHLPREAGQPCHSNVKHMWSRPENGRPKTHTHTHKRQRTEQQASRTTLVYPSVRQDKQHRNYAPHHLLS